MRTKAHGDGGGGKAGRSRAAPAATRAAAPIATQAADSVAEPIGQATAPIPHRAAMERAFGLSFGDVTARTGAGAALDPLGANAATQGSQIAFRAANPRPAQVAHELTHVLQQRQPSSDRGIGAPCSAAEQEASRNAMRVDLGLAPKVPRERASPEAVYRDVKGDLRKAIEGWGTDEEAIYTRLGTATEPEKEAVRSDPALMEDLRDDLNRHEWVRVLNLLGLGLETQIREAGSGWGTDEEGIYRAVEGATAPALKQMIANGPVLLDMRSELTDGELGRVLGTVADKYKNDAGTTDAETYHVMMLFPDSVDESCDKYDKEQGGSGGTTGLIGALPAGHSMAQGTVSDVDTHIANDDSLARVVAAFRRRWNLQTGRGLSPPGPPPTTFTAGTQDWSVGKVRAVHRALQQVPPSHVTRAGQNISSIGLDPNTSAGGYWSVGIGMIGLNKDSSSIDSVTRHEVGHSIDDHLGGVSTAFKQNAINGWDWGGTAATWQTHMPDPWKRKDGSLVPAADQVKIMALLNSYVASDGSANLRTFAGTGHAEIDKYWGDDVNMIEAAKPLAGKKDKVWDSPGSIKSFGAFYFSWSAYYHRFHCYKKVVLDERVSNYSLFGHPEFFAELYEAYYADGPGADRGKKLKKVPNWKSFFDNTVHGVS